MTDTEKETKKEKEIFFEKETEKDTAKGRETARETARATEKAAPGPKPEAALVLCGLPILGEASSPTEKPHSLVTTGMTMGLRLVVLNR